jgi:hypothetical protein
MMLCAAGALLPAVAAGAPGQRPPTAQTAPAAQAESGPIAIVPIDSSNPDQAATVTGALEVTGGRAIIAASGSVSSGSRTTEVVLPHRGVLRVCASTTVKLAADSSVPAGETPGLLVAMDHGAIEMSFATLQNADIVLTPDFRILIGGPGASEVKVRLGSGGDTCVDNSGANAPYVLVSSVFEGDVYRVQPGQRVMFEHGSLHEVVDQEKEPCGCPPPPSAAESNEFPLAQSEGLAPLPKPAPSAVNQSGAPAQPLSRWCTRAQTLQLGLMRALDRKQRPPPGQLQIRLRNLPQRRKRPDSSRELAGFLSASSARSEDFSSRRRIAVLWGHRRANTSRIDYCAVN